MKKLRYKHEGLNAIVEQDVYTFNVKNIGSDSADYFLFKDNNPVIFSEIDVCGNLSLWKIVKNNYKNIMFDRIRVIGTFGQIETVFGVNDKADENYKVSLPAHKSVTIIITTGTVIRPISYDKKHLDNH